eukprot:TRINITY_DN12618_c0_g1_i1.p1 TRINITY_DN12618_c0_g1~~TRINITY_DN12618_c0_g1_i1.p1  ORF type:complete len:385 (+),score=60.95 TRINITY_DN12618_c0_g1_i1:173-1156(+)
MAEVEQRLAKAKRRADERYATEDGKRTLASSLQGEHDHHSKVPDWSGIHGKLFTHMPTLGDYAARRNMVIRSEGPIAAQPVFHIGASLSSAGPVIPTATRAKRSRLTTNPFGFGGCARRVESKGLRKAAEAPTRNTRRTAARAAVRSTPVQTGFQFEPPPTALRVPTIITTKDRHRELYSIAETPARSAVFAFRGTEETRCPTITQSKRVLRSMSQMNSDTGFDLAKSLSKPLPYKPKRGRLPPFPAGAENAAPQPRKIRGLPRVALLAHGAKAASVSTQGTSDRRRDIKNRTFTSRNEGRAKQQALRVQSRGTLVMQRRRQEPSNT